MKLKSIIVTLAALVLAIPVFTVTCRQAEQVYSLDVLSPKGEIVYTVLSSTPPRALPEPESYAVTEMDTGRVKILHGTLISGEQAADAAEMSKAWCESSGHVIIMYEAGGDSQRL